MIRVLVGIVFGVFIIVRLLVAYIQEVRDEVSIRRGKGKGN